MNFAEYQAAARATSYHVGLEPIVYASLKLNGESGEIAEKVGKLYRDHGGELSHEYRQNLVLELGDVLWYVAEIATILGVSLESVAAGNIEKLRSRSQRGTLQGNGDNR